MLLSAFKRKSRELSIEYLNSPELGRVCEISSKEREGPPSFRLKAPHIYTRYKAIIINRAGSVTTPCFQLKLQVFLFIPLLSTRSRFLFCHSTLVRLRRGRARRHSSNNGSIRSLQLQPHHQCFKCRRHGLLVVLLVLCDTRSVAALLLV